MKLYIMRHGPAEDAAASGIDADRALSASGRTRVASVAGHLVELGEEPVAIFTSPLVRAVQTAEIVAMVTKLGDRKGTVETRREVGPGGDAVALAHQLAAAGRKRVMFVGHEPDYSAHVAALVGSFGRPFDKAMVVGLHLGSGGGRARLRFVLDPKTLALDPDAREG